MIRAGWFLTGLVALAWLVNVVAYEPFLYPELEWIFITFMAALVVIAIWIVIGIVSGIEASARIRCEMRSEQPPDRVDS